MTSDRQLRKDPGGGLEDAAREPLMPRSARPAAYHPQHRKSWRGVKLAERIMSFRHRGGTRGA